MIRKCVVYAAVVSTLTGFSACAHTVRDYFEETRLSYPIHVDRTPRPARGPKHGRCIELPEYQAFFDAALAALTKELVGQIARGACPLADAVVLVHPYILIDHEEKRVKDKPVVYEPVPRLAMQVNCFGTEEFKPGVRFEAARGGVGTRTPRSGAMEVAADGWAIWRVQGSIWRMWNVALFNHTGGRTVFLRFRHDVDEALNLERIGLYPERAMTCDPVGP